MTSGGSWSSPQTPPDNTSPSVRSTRPGAGGRVIVHRHVAHSPPRGPAVSEHARRPGALCMLLCNHPPGPKTVTVVFCDVTGSTAPGDRLDPESLRNVIDGLAFRAAG